MMQMSAAHFGDRVPKQLSAFQSHPKNNFRVN